MLTRLDEDDEDDVPTRLDEDDRGADEDDVPTRLDEDEGVPTRWSKKVAAKEPG